MGRTLKLVAVLAALSLSTPALAQSSGFVPSKNKVYGNFQVVNGLVFFGQFTSDPSGSVEDGAMYYNSADDVYRCRVNGAWSDCFGSSSSSSGSGGMAIGDPIAGSVPNSVLFADGSGNLGQDPGNFDYDGSRLLFGQPVRIGRDVGTQPLTITGQDTAGVVAQMYAYSNTAGDRGRLVISKSRGTLASPDKILNNAVLGSVDFEGNNTNAPGAANFVASAGIRAQASENWLVGQHGTKVIISATGDGASTPTDRLIIHGSGLLENSFYQPGAMIVSSAGIIDYLDGTTAQVLHGGNGSAPTFGAVALASEVSGVLPVANGGTGSGTQNFVDLTTNQSAAGNKTFTARLLASAHANNVGMRVPTFAGAPSAVTGTQEGDVVYDSTNNALYCYDGSAFSACNSSGGGSVTATNGQADRIGVFSSATNINGSANFTWNGSNFSVITTTGPATTISLNSVGSGQNAPLRFNTDATAANEQHNIEWYTNNNGALLGRLGLVGDGTVVKFSMRDMYNGGAGSTELFSFSANNAWSLGSGNLVADTNGILSSSNGSLRFALNGTSAGQNTDLRLQSDAYAVGEQHNIEWYSSGSVVSFGRFGMVGDGTKFKFSMRDMFNGSAGSTEVYYFDADDSWSLGTGKLAGDASGFLSSTVGPLTFVRNGTGAGQNAFFQFRTNGYSNGEQQNVEWYTTSGSVALARFGMIYDAGDVTRFVMRDMYNGGTGSTEAHSFSATGAVAHGTGFTISGSGAITAATGITSSGTITFSGLGAGAVTTNSSGVLSSSAGTAGQVLTSNGAGNAPTFQAAPGGISGSGTGGQVARWTNTTVLGDAALRDDGTQASIGIAPISGVPWTVSKTLSSVSYGVRLSAPSYATGDSYNIQWYDVNQGIRGSLGWEKGSSVDNFAFRDGSGTKQFTFSSDNSFNLGSGLFTMSSTGVFGFSAGKQVNNTTTSAGVNEDFRFFTTSYASGDSHVLGWFDSNQGVLGQFGVNRTSGENRFTMRLTGTELFTFRDNGTLQIITDGSAGTPTLYWNTDTNTGVYHPASDTLAMSANGSERFKVNGTGVSWFGATPVAQQASGADLTNNVTSGGSNDVIANFTDMTIYANDAATIRNDIYQLARKLKQVNDAMRAYGLLN